MTTEDSGKKPSPFSMRLTEGERALLERRAGDMPLGTYVRSRLLEGNASPRRRAKKPKIDQNDVAKVLAILGQSRLASNLNQLAKAANSGSLPVTPDIEAMLQAAYRDIKSMKKMLMAALGILER